MAQIRSSILFTGAEQAKEMAQKLMDLQRQLEARIHTLEKKNADLEDRLSEIED